MKKRVTLHDVAKAAGVSIATVSYALNNRDNKVSNELREDILKIVEKMGYKQNRVARAMKTGNTEIIGFVIPNIENPFFAMLSQQILHAAKQYRYQVFILGTEGSIDNQNTAINSLIQQGVDGIIVFPVNESIAIDCDDIPVVVLDRQLPDTDTVVADYYQAGKHIAKHLLKLGHKRFGLIDGPNDVSSSVQRSQGVIDTISTNGTITWQVTHPYTSSLNQETKTYLNTKSVTAVVCGNDLIAIAALLHLQSQKINVPEQVSLVGFDDIFFAKMMNPSLTTIKIPVKEMAYKSVDLLFNKISNKKQGKQYILVDTELVIRQSTTMAY